MLDFDDSFEYYPNDMKYFDSIDDHQKEIFDIPIIHSTPTIPHLKSLTRSIDFPSQNKHYGLITFFDIQFPIIYRLMNDNFYIPYIRFSYVLQIFEHSSLKKYLLNIRNLPVIEMTSIERIYYDQLSSIDQHSDWSQSQLLNISILDGILTMIKFTQNIHYELNSIQWQETMNKIRKETQQQWILDEKLVQTRLTNQKSLNSSCISSNTLLNRRSLLEQRLDHSIIDNAGGFVQIGLYIYPFIKNPLDNQIYINLNDIHQNFIRPLNDMINYSKPSSPMYHLYEIIFEQAQKNFKLNHKRNFIKILPSRKEYFNDDLPFLSLQRLLHLFLTKNSQFNIQFVQLFETSTFNEIEINYQNNISQQFILNTNKSGGLINNKIPCLINQHFIFIPSEKKTNRLMTNNERLYLNLILLYNGLWKYVLTRKKQWFLKQINENEKENIQLDILQGK